VISFTGYYDYTPNLFTHNLKTGKTIQNTDLWNMYQGVDWNKNLSTVTAMTLSTVDSSRILEVDPTRSVETSKVNMNPIFSSWRTKSPDNPIVDVDPKKSVEILNEERYSF